MDLGQEMRLKWKGMAEVPVHPSPLSAIQMVWSIVLKENG